MRIDSEKLNRVISENIESLCRHFFPHWKKIGHEWKIGDVTGVAGESLAIELDNGKPGVWKDRATDKGGWFTNLVMESRGLHFPDAAHEIGRASGVNVEEAGNQSNNGATHPFNWEEFASPLNERQKKKLAEWRGLSPGFVNWLCSENLIRADAKHWVFPIHKDGKITGAHSRPFEWPDDKHNWDIYPTKKNGGPGVQPLVIGNLKESHTVHFFESQWDQLAVCDRLMIHETDGVACMSTRGTGNNGFAARVPGSVQQVYIWTQNDNEGQEWARKAANDLPLESSAKIVLTPKEFADPNEWTLAGAEAKELLDAVKNAVPAGGTEPQTENKGRELLGGSILKFANAAIDESKTLLGNRFLCVGGGMFTVGQSGIGKSSTAIQVATLWSCGRSAFEIKPSRPLKILIVQAEDDAGDVTEASRMIDKLGLTKEEIEIVDANTWIEQINDVCGDKFIDELDGILEHHPVDLVIINPFTSYLGADDKDTEACIHFLRNRLTPLLTKHNCAAIIFHHTPKTNFGKTDEYKPSDWMYRGAGAAALTNWARAYLVIDPCEGTGGVFKFIAAKRGKRIGWSDHIPCFEKYFRHSNEDDVILWEPATHEEVSAAKESKKENVDSEKLLSLLPLLDPILKPTFVQMACAKLNMGEKKIEAAMKELELSGKVFVHQIPNPSKGRAFVGWAKTPSNSNS